MCPPVTLSLLMFSLRSIRHVTAPIATTQHRQMKLPTNPEWYRGPGEAPKITGPMTFPTQYPTKVEALTVAFSKLNQLPCYRIWPYRRRLTGVTGHV